MNSAATASAPSASGPAAAATVTPYTGAAASMHVNWKVYVTAFAATLAANLLVAILFV